MEGVGLRLVLTPEDPSRQIADLEDDEPMVLAIIGPKHYLLDLATGFTSMSLDWNADLNV